MRFPSSSAMTDSVNASISVMFSKVMLPANLRQYDNHSYCCDGWASV